MTAHLRWQIEHAAIFGASLLVISGAYVSLGWHPSIIHALAYGLGMLSMFHWTREPQP